MFLDLIQPDKQCSFNIKLAHTIGLQSAVYCGELLNILGQVVKKNKFVDGDYFRLDRQYVTNRTTLSLEEQYDIDQALTRINLIGKHPKDKDCIKFDVKLLVDIIADNNIEVKNDLLWRTKVKTSKEAKDVKNKAIKEALKLGIKCTNDELLNALWNWVDSVYESGKILSKTKVLTFQTTLNDYTKGDLDLALEIVRIATLKAYVDCNWAIKYYEKEQTYKRVDAQKSVSDVMLTDYTRTSVEDNVIKSKEELGTIQY